MKIGALILSIMVHAVLAVSVLAQSQEHLSFRCIFGPGTSTAWEHGRPKIERGDFGSPTVTVHFNSIDLSSGTAQMAGNGGTSDVLVLSTGSGLTFVEHTSFGNLIFTTIFKSDVPGRNELIAVMSRHMQLFTDPVPSQYHGTCMR